MTARFLLTRLVVRYCSSEIESIGLEHLARRREAHLGVAPDVHDVVDDHDVVFGESGLDEVLDDLLIDRSRIALLLRAAEHGGTTDHRQCEHSL